MNPLLAGGTFGAWIIIPILLACGIEVMPLTYGWAWIWTTVFVAETLWRKLR